VTSAAFDAETAAGQVAAALLPLADAGRAGQAIRKAIGWVLRETAKKDPAYVVAWTRSHLDQMCGVTFREAVRRLPAEQAALLQLRRQGLDSA
jgi:3-methyladenine DNA glycosylase AlkD